jgi:integrase
MSICKRGEVWYIDLAKPNGERIRRSLKTSDKRAAQEVHDRLKADLWREAKLGEKPARYWEEAALRWLNETTKRTAYDDALRIKQITPKLKGLALTEIKREVWNSVLDFLRDRIVRDREARNKALREKGKPEKPIDHLAINGTLNRYTALVSAILNKARREWEWIDSVPCLKRFKEKPGRVRWITPEQAQRLLAELPEHLREAVLFSLATGLRQANVFRLEWGWIDLQHRVIRIPGAQFKNGDDHGVALSDAAIEVLKRQIGKHHVRVFTYKGKPIAAPGLAWKKALSRAGIDDFRWHDLRHTSFSWLRQKGVSLDVIEAIGGWRDGKMARRYAHIAAHHLVPHVKVLDNVLAHLRHTGVEEGNLRSATP